MAVAIVVAALLAHAWLHAAAGWTLPVPWPDELHFALPSFALLDHGDLHSRALHPDRPLMWMPPGYAIAMSPIYALFGPSLAVARAMSWLAMSGAIVVVWRLAAHAGRPRLGALAAAAFALHPAVVASGNVARMDAGLLLIASLGVWLMARARAWTGLAVLFFAPLLHPNGLFFCAAGVVALVLLRPGKPTRRESAWIAAVALAWLAYGAHVVVHWDGFVADMGYQIARKTQRNLADALRGQHALRLAVLLALLASPEHRRRWRWLATLAIPSWILARVGHEMWYEPFDALVATAILIVATDAALSWASSRQSPHAGRVGLAFALGATGWLLAGERPHPPGTLRWKGMAVRSAPYLDADERRAVDHAVAELAAPTVEVFPRGDALLILAGLRGRLVDPVRSDVSAALLIVHESPAHPRRWRERAAAFVAEGRASLLYEGRGGAWWVVTRAR